MFLFLVLRPGKQKNCTCCRIKFSIIHGVIFSYTICQCFSTLFCLMAPLISNMNIVAPLDAKIDLMINKNGNRRNPWHDFTAPRLRTTTLCFKWKKKHLFERKQSSWSNKICWKVPKKNYKLSYSKEIFYSNLQYWTI